jgi:uncharacterized protein (DUF58 family)
MVTTPNQQKIKTQPKGEFSIDPEILAELKRIQIRTKRTLNADLVGQYRSAFRGTGLDFSDLRAYQPGDDIRHIHWKVTARTKQPFVKTYEEDRQLSIVIAVDISRSMDFGAPKSKFRRAQEFAALLATLANNNRDSVSLCLFAGEVIDYIPSRGTRTQLQQLLLTLLEQRSLPSETNLANALRHIRSHLKKTSVVFLLSDFLSTSFEDELRALSYKHDVVCANIEDRFDKTLPSVGLVTFQDSESGESVLVDTSNKRALQTLSDLESKRVRDLETICKRCRVDFITIKDKLLQPLSALMQQRTRRVR